MVRATIVAASARVFPMTASSVWQVTGARCDALQRGTEKLKGAYPDRATTVKVEQECGDENSTAWAFFLACSARGARPLYISPY
jgi:hypothetical protein